MKQKLRDEFLSDEDLSLRGASEEERNRAWDAWLRQAQSTNEQDRHLYSHGVFLVEPPWRARSRRQGAVPDAGR